MHPLGPRSRPTEAGADQSRSRRLSNWHRGIGSRSARGGRKRGPGSCGSSVRTRTGCRIVPGWRGRRRTSRRVRCTGCGAGRSRVGACRANSPSVSTSAAMAPVLMRPAGVRCRRVRGVRSRADEFSPVAMGSRPLGVGSGVRGAKARCSCPRRCHPRARAGFAGGNVSPLGPGPSPTQGGAFAGARCLVSSLRPRRRARADRSVADMNEKSSA